MIDQRFRLTRRTLLAGTAAATALASATPAFADTMLLNVSYDPTRELYRDVNALFSQDWKTRTGETVGVRSSHGGSGAQARAVIDGIEADVVTLALAPDIDAIVAATGKIPANWKERLPNGSCPYTSTIVFLVRKGNPKGIRDWADLAKPGIQVITPNPKTSGGARWNYLAAWGSALKAGRSDEEARAFVQSIYAHAPVLDTGARGATITFAQRGLGDVLIAWENDAFLAADEFGRDRVDIVAPSVSIVAEPPVALVDGNVDRRGTRTAAESYLSYLYSPAVQAIIARHHYRPFKPEAARAEDLARLPKLDLFRIEDLFGSWKDAQARHFAAGGIYDGFARAGR